MQNREPEVATGSQSFVASQEQRKTPGQQTRGQVGVAANMDLEVGVGVRGDNSGAAERIKVKNKQTNKNL